MTSCFVGARPRPTARLSMRSEYIPGDARTGHHQPWHPLPRRESIERSDDSVVAAVKRHTIARAEHADAGPGKNAKPSAGPRRMHREGIATRPADESRIGLSPRAAAVVAALAVRAASAGRVAPSSARRRRLPND